MEALEFRSMILLMGKQDKFSPILSEEKNFGKLPTNFQTRHCTILERHRTMDMVKALHIST